jgi:hypothetical protein
MYGFCFVVGVMYHIKTSWLDATNVSAWMVVIVVRLNESPIEFFSIYFIFQTGYGHHDDHPTFVHVPPQ